MSHQFCLIGHLGNFSAGLTRAHLRGSTQPGGLHAPSDLIPRLVAAAAAHRALHPCAYLLAQVPVRGSLGIKHNCRFCYILLIKVYLKDSLNSTEGQDGLSL